MVMATGIGRRHKDNTRTKSITELPDHGVFDEAGNFVVDGTRCTVGVVRPDASGVQCGKPAHEQRCEFHALLDYDYQLRDRMRTGTAKNSNGTRVAVVAIKHSAAYQQLIGKMAAAIKRDHDRANASDVIGSR